MIVAEPQLWEDSGILSTSFMRYDVRVCHIWNDSYHTPASTKLAGGISVSTCPPVCPSVDEIVSALYLPQSLCDN